MTDTERQTAQARTALNAPATTQAPAAPPIENVPAYAADPGDHEAMLDDFLTENNDWEKYRTWSDDTTHAIHESQTLRIEHVHEAHPRDTAWTVAAYETPVSDRMWHLTATGWTPTPMLQTLLTHLVYGDGWDTVIGSPVTDETVGAATQPLTDAGWKHTVDGRWIRWTNPSEDAGVQFDAFAAQNPNSPRSAWTVWAGPSIDQLTWAIRASASTPDGLLADLAKEIAHGSGIRKAHRHQAVRNASGVTTACQPAAPPHTPPVVPRR
ncbi:DUF317 domain-containing protein [Streptomyces sp. NBC_00576]|uniref:DUF317 domain-containing protein n=1 Tax=Streptomyces sp. NBC_00576 TaxID=2903665 RepID=UPI002E80E3E8|nr:DUF317 domain-containing protein [Streptomyces sp. NBC_00576]WUB69314.1 DUF317 domain-containing protein [Streptomyces sp. NBC_00576]